MPGLLPEDSFVPSLFERLLPQPQQEEESESQIKARAQGGEDGKASDHWAATQIPIPVVIITRALPVKIKDENS